MDLIQNFFHTVYNVPELIRIVGQFGLPLIIFAETGLVVAPFLPGDSLLFAAGALSASSGAFNMWLLVPLLIVAAVLGDAVNYTVGNAVGPRVFTGSDQTSFWHRLLNPCGSRPSAC